MKVYSGGGGLCTGIGSFTFTYRCDREVLLLVVRRRRRCIRFPRQNVTQIDIGSSFLCSLFSLAGRVVGGGELLGTIHSCYDDGVEEPTSSQMAELSERWPSEVVCSRCRRCACSAMACAGGGVVYV